MYCPCEALVEDDAEELHCLLDLVRDVIDLQDDICRDVLASSEENDERLVNTTAAANNNTMLIQYETGRPSLVNQVKVVQHNPGNNTMLIQYETGRPSLVNQVKVVQHNRGSK